jgi:NAD(P)-dependent dehydrogenase (short-subunit alcohol dehydrogenase family)
MSYDEEGAGAGIGQAISLELARRGALVVCADIDLADDPGLKPGGKSGLAPWVQSCAMTSIMTI